MRILNACVQDFANFSHDNAKALRSVGIDCVDVKVNKHQFGYEVESKLMNLREIDAIIKDFDIIQIMHSDLKILKIAKNKGKRLIVYHTGSRYRGSPSFYNKEFNPFVERSFIALCEFNGLGAKNQTYIFGAVEVPPLKIESINNIYKIGHYPSNPDVKGTDAILSLLNDVKQKYELYHSKDIVRHFKQVKRYKTIDIYIELFKPLLAGKKYGSFGITALEVGALGKVVVTQNLSKELYEETYGIAPFVLCENEKDFVLNIEKLLSLQKRELKKLQIDTYNWVKNNHSYEATGNRLKKIYGL